MAPFSLWSTLPGESSWRHNHLLTLPLPMPVQLPLRILGASCVRRAFVVFEALFQFYIQFYITTVTLRCETFSEELQACTSSQGSACCRPCLCNVFPPLMLILSGSFPRNIRLFQTTQIWFSEQCQVRLVRSLKFLQCHCWMPFNALLYFCT